MLLQGKKVEARSATACNSHVYKENFKFGLKYHPSMRIFVYGLSSSDAQCPSYNTNKETVMYKPQLHCITCIHILAERQLLHWAVRNGHIRISQALLKFVSYVGAPNFRGETPLHVTSNEGYHLVMAREHVFLIKLMTCSLMCVLLVILIVMGIRIRQREHSVKSLSTSCTKTTSSSSGKNIYSSHVDIYRR